jgi:hypothetical protein
MLRGFMQDWKTNVQEDKKNKHWTELDRGGDI